MDCGGGRTVENRNIREKYGTVEVESLALSSPALVVLVSAEPLDLVEAEEESPSLILGGLRAARTEEAGGLKTLTAQGDLKQTQFSSRLVSVLSSHLGSKARLLPGVLGALTVAAVLSQPVLLLPALPLPSPTDTWDSSVLAEVTARRNILGEWIRALVRKPEKEGEEVSSWPWPWLSLPCRRVCLGGEKYNCLTSRA